MQTIPAPGNGGSGGCNATADWPGEPRRASRRAIGQQARGSHLQKRRHGVHQAAQERCWFKGSCTTPWRVLLCCCCSPVVSWVSDSRLTVSRGGSVSVHIHARNFADEETRKYDFSPFTVPCPSPQTSTGHLPMLCLPMTGDDVMLKPHDLNVD